MFHKFGSKYRSVIVAVGPMFVAVPAFAVDYSTAVTAATTEVNGAVVDALPLLALIIGIVVGLRMFKRFAKG